MNRSNKKFKRSKSRRKSITKPKYMSCNDFLKKKISINMKKYKSGKLLSNKKRIKNRKQAIAISYSQIKKAGCK